MSDTDVLSVNPGKTTLGDLNPDACLSMFRNRVLNRLSRQARTRDRDILGVRTPGGTRRNATLLAMRVAFGALLIAGGCMSVSVDHLDATGVVDYIALAENATYILEIVAGGVLLTGFLTRILMVAAACGFAAIAISAAMAGVFDQCSVMCALVCMMFALSGPGKISIDRVIANSIDRARKCQV